MLFDADIPHAFEISEIVTRAHKTWLAAPTSHYHSPCDSVKIATADSSI